MKILLGGAGGVGDAFAKIAARRSFFECIDASGAEIFAPSFSIGAAIEECLNPPVVWEKDKGWFTTEPFSEPEVFMFPEGIGPVECVNVEHEEVLMMPRWLDAERVTFTYGLGNEFRGILKTLHQLGLDSVTPVKVRTAAGPVMVAPRDVWQTALNPVIALELLATGAWKGVGVVGPEFFDAEPFLTLMALPEAEGGYGQAWGLEERLAQ